MEQFRTNRERISKATFGVIGIRALRYTLWASFPFNLAAACLLAFPSTRIGQFAGLPELVPALYSSTLSFLVFLFGVAYAWLAMQPSINRPLLAVSAIGKSGVFAIALVLWLLNSTSGRVVVVAVGDLVFAAIWFGWLFSSVDAPPTDD